MAIDNTATFQQALAALKDYAGVNQTSDLINLINNTIGANTDAIKKNLVATLNAKLGTTLAVDTAWPLILQAITGASVKRWASGTATSSSTDITVWAGNNATTSQKYVEVTGLTFTPSFIYLFTDGNGHMTTYLKDRNYTELDIDVSYASNTYRVKAKADNSLYVENGAFRLLVSTASTVYKWYAFE